MWTAAHGPRSGFQHWPEPYGWLPSVPATLLNDQAFE